MKKIKYLLLIICIFSLLTGCTSKKENNKKNNNKEEVKEVDKTLFTINGYEFHLDKEASYEGLKYTISSDFTEGNHQNCIQYSYYPDDGGNNLLFFRVFYYEDKDESYIKNDLAIEGELTFKDGKTDNIEYKLYDENRKDGTIRFYFIYKDNKTYVVNFVSKYDIKDFETKVLDTLKFE